ncbi:hypothetical protein TrVE_jg11493 [Triparma verrucosa]|nr:hypothetical protein TrVE_jg11493 [Triparma verrucosa]
MEAARSELKNRKQAILEDLKKSTDFEKESDEERTKMLERHEREKEQFKSKRINKQKELVSKVVCEDKLKQVLEELDVSSKELRSLLFVDGNGDGEMDI